MPCQNRDHGLPCQNRDHALPGQNRGHVLPVQAIPVNSAVTCCDVNSVCKFCLTVAARTLRRIKTGAGYLKISIVCCCCPILYVKKYHNYIHPAGTTRHLVGATRHLVGATRHLVGATRHLVGATRHLVGATRHRGCWGDTPSPKKKKQQNNCSTSPLPMWVGRYATTQTNNNREKCSNSPLYLLTDVIHHYR